MWPLIHSKLIPPRIVIVLWCSPLSTSNPNYLYSLYRIVFAPLHSNVDLLLTLTNITLADGQDSLWIWRESFITSPSSDLRLISTVPLSTVPSVFPWPLKVGTVCLSHYSFVGPRSERSGGKWESQTLTGRDSVRNWQTMRIHPLSQGY